MLTEIRIRNFAVIERLSLAVGPGFSVLTGETGAGKSILLGALGLTLGDRASADILRPGADRAEVTAVFEPEPASEATQWLVDHDLDADGECVVRRVIPREGRSRAYVNGQPVPVQSLRALGDRLMDIHGQHEHQSLIRRDVQRRIVDKLGDCGSLVEKTSTAFGTLKTLMEDHERLVDANAGRDARADLLRHHLGELDALDLGDTELPELEAEARRVENVERLAGGVHAALEALFDRDSGSAQAVLGGAARTLNELVELDDRLAEAAELVAAAEIQASEAADSLRRYVDHLDADPGRAAWLAERIGTAHGLARKHRVSAHELPALRTRLRTELDELDNTDQRLEELDKAVAQARDRYLKHAKTLSRRRHKTAADFGKRITEVMQGLGMPGGRFDARVTTQEPPATSAHGIDVVEFLVSANPGQPTQPLGRVASGGELSRISLAIQVVAAGAAPVPSMVFDEVDAGVGGGVAQIVGEQLRALGAVRQVLCVTHLPQVASQAGHQFRVSKLTDGKSTRTTIAALDDDQRIEELARMLGGVEITETTRDHAREMIDRARRQSS